MEIRFGSDENDAVIAVLKGVATIMEQETGYTAFIEFVGSFCYSNQFPAITSITEKMFNGANERIGLLFAQPQSGKTGVYLTVAYIALVFGFVENVVIVLGTDDTDLYTHTRQETASGFNKFIGRICGYFGVSREIDHRLGELCDHIVVLKSHDLVRAVLPDNALIIFDESHYAQSVDNRPAKMFARCYGLENLSGSDETLSALEEHNVHILTVSATPFSELATEYESRFGKLIVTLNPGAGYRGLMWYDVEKQLRASWNPIQEIEKTKQLLLDQSIEGVKRYGIMRISACQSFGKMSEIVQSCGWKCEPYMAPESKSTPNGINTILSVQPAHNTVIVIVDKCRMGEVLTKTHVAFVFEYTKSGGKTDTNIQGLTGRMFGYSGFNKFGITIYASSKFLENSGSRRLKKKQRKQLDAFDAKHHSRTDSAHDDERRQLCARLESVRKTEEMSEAYRYRGVAEGSELLPRLGMNLTHKSCKSETTMYSIVPFEISTEHGSEAAEIVQLAHELNGQVNDYIIERIQQFIQLNPVLCCDDEQRTELSRSYNNLWCGRNFDKKTYIDHNLPNDMAVCIAESVPFEGLSRKNNLHIKGHQFAVIIQKSHPNSVFIAGATLNATDQTKQIIQRWANPTSTTVCIYNPDAHMQMEDVVIDNLDSDGARTLSDLICKGGVRGRRRFMIRRDLIENDSQAPKTCLGETINSVLRKGGRQRSQFIHCKQTRGRPKKEYPNTEWLYITVEITADIDISDEHMRVEVQLAVDISRGHR